MTTKRILCERGLRRIPAQFSWVDQRLVFDGHLGRCDAHAAALYLLLVTVADAQGLSYWGDARVTQLLRTQAARLARARGDLVGAGLIAYERPLYQVLALDARALPSVQAVVATGPPPCTSPSTSPLPAPADTSAASLGVDRQAILERLAQLRARLVGPR